MGCVIHFVLTGSHPFGVEDGRQAKIQTNKSSLHVHVRDSIDSTSVPDVQSVGKL